MNFVVTLNCLLYSRLFPWPEVSGWHKKGLVLMKQENSPGLENPTSDFSPSLPVLVELRSETGMIGSCKQKPSRGKVTYRSDLAEEDVGKLGRKTGNAAQ